jgi:hypothetical protein
VAGVKPTPVSIFYYFSTHLLLFFFNYFFHSPTQTHAILLSLLFRLTLPHSSPLSLALPFSLSPSLRPSLSLRPPSTSVAHPRSHSGARVPATGEEVGFCSPSLAPAKTSLSMPSDPRKYRARHPPTGLFWLIFLQHNKNLGLIFGWLIFLFWFAEKSLGFFFFFFFFFFLLSLSFLSDLG